MLCISQTQDPIDNVPEYNRNSYISYTGRDPSQRAFNMFYQGADDLRKRGPRATMQVIHLPQALARVRECGCECVFFSGCEYVCVVCEVSGVRE